MTDALTDTLYRSTRTAWEDIWQSADVAAEVATMRYPRSQQTIAAYLPYLPKDQPILEAGSGLSAAMIVLQERGYAVVGLDYALNALKASHTYDPTLDLMGGDVHALPFATDSVGAYLSFGVLEHFAHGMTPALTEAYRILQPGGTLVMTIPYPNLIWKIAQRRRAVQGKQRIDEDFYESTYTQVQLTAECTKVGFDVVRTLPTSHAFTLWGAHRLFRGAGYYESSAWGNLAGQVVSKLAPWTFNFMTLVIAHK